MSESLVAPPPDRIRRGGRPPIDRPERVIGQVVRLRMLLTLEGVESMTFSRLQEVVSTNYGNLSLHARKLERFGYIRIEKSFVDRIPRTEYRLTSEGRQALRLYLDEHPSTL